jgi:hypothetical protein
MADVSLVEGTIAVGNYWFFFCFTLGEPMRSWTTNGRARKMLEEFPR